MKTIVTMKTDRLISSRYEVSDSEDSTADKILSKNKILRKAQPSRCTEPRRTTSRTQLSSRCKGPLKLVVNHNYHDHLYDPMFSSYGCERAFDENEEESGKHRPSIHRGGVAVPFPVKLHYMLSRMDVEGTNSIISWQPHGRCFLVHKPKEFIEEIMPA